MNIKNIFNMYQNKEVKVWNTESIEADKELLGLKGSPTKVKKSMTKEPKGNGELVQLQPKEAAQYVVSKLKQNHFI
jgi:electron transfer flavoprotein beta subunit